MSNINDDADRAAAAEPTEPTELTEGELDEVSGAGYPQGEAPINIDKWRRP